nr:cell death abnormality protein 1-like isoform X2 [Crassostrea gigas]
MRYKSIFDTISVVKECDEICPEFTMHYPFLLCLVCALSNAQLSEQNPVKPNTNTNQCKIWNEMLPKCEECNVGFFGINCSIPCRYPSYGNKCQSLCNCLEIDCHPATGCKDGLPTISSPAAVLISSKQGNTPELFTTNKIECPVGYTGNQCDIRCRYPSFGYLCQFACNCSKERCNFTKGCDVSPTHCAADKRIKQNEAMFYITIVLGVWAAVQCVIYFCLSCGLVSCDFDKKYHVIE